MIVPDLPVAVNLAPPLAAEVVAYVEGEAGWQVVGLDGPPRPVLVLADAPVPGHATVVVVEGVPDGARVRAALQAGAVDVVSWPSERDRLAGAVTRASARPPSGEGPPLLKVAGSAGGVGTSTVTLALAGLLAWAGRRAVVVGGDDLLVLAGLGAWSGPGVAEVAQLDTLDAGHEVDGLARPVPGVRGLRVLGGGASALGSVAAVAGSPVGPLVDAAGGSQAGGSVVGAAADPPAGGSPVAGWPADVVVADLGATTGVGGDLCCARADAHLSRIAGCRAPVAMVADGPVPPRSVRRVLGRDPVAWLPASARVARAGARGRVPADLPGTWLAALRAALPAVRLAWHD